MQANEAQALSRGARVTEDERNSSGVAAGAEAGTANGGQTKAGEPQLMRAVVEWGNVLRAHTRVTRNKGAPGVDGMTVGELMPWLEKHWPSVRATLLAGLYLPAPVRVVEIPKASGNGMRQLGIPTVLDRLIQQMALQVLQPLFEVGFSESSYGFRPHRSAADAVKAARGYAQSGLTWVADLDLEKFFDRVNHDILMSRVARTVKDPAVLTLIRRYIGAGMMQNGVVSAREEGTPQGGPLSPLLSNILLTDLDRELESRGLKFCRYADDCNIYVGSEGAARHAMASITAFLEGVLRLKVNQDKSACSRPWLRKFLGFSMLPGKAIRLRIAPASVMKLKDKVRALMRTGRGCSLAVTVQRLTPVLRGWMAYFRWTEATTVLATLDQWLRRKLRCLIWRLLKRHSARLRAFQRQGLDYFTAWKSAGNGHGPWWNSGRQHMNKAYPTSYFTNLGLVSLVQMHKGSQC